MGRATARIFSRPLVACGRRRKTGWCWRARRVRLRHRRGGGRRRGSIRGRGDVACSRFRARSPGIIGLIRLTEHWLSDAALVLQVLDRGSHLVSVPRRPLVGFEQPRRRRACVGFIPVFRPYDRQHPSSPGRLQSSSRPVHRVAQRGPRSIRCRRGRIRAGCR